MKRDEIRVYGQSACRALFERRPGDILRVLLDEKSARQHSALLKHCARARLPYRVVGREELEKVAGARHHEGICIVARPGPEPRLVDILERPGPGILLALDRIGNPHNLGTLLRTAAHFGARAVLVAGDTQRRLSSAAYRTAEGAAEAVDVVFAEELAPLLRRCQVAGYAVCASSSHRGQSLFESALPARALFLLGSEGEGLAAPLFAAADLCLSIPGTGAVESLNVASSAAVFLGEHWRQHGSPAQARS